MVSMFYLKSCFLSSQGGYFVMTNATYSVLNCLDSKLLPLKVMSNQIIQG